MRRTSWPIALSVGALSIAWLGAHVAGAVIVRHDRELETTLELGARFPFVCSAGAGSGALIAPRWVLTAAHVVEGFSPFDFRVRFRDREYPVVRTFIHPGDEEMPWDRRRHDVALLLLEKPVQAIAPTTLFRAAGELGEMEELGKAAVIAGTGFFGKAGEGTVARDGRLRAVTNRISDLEQNWLKTVFSRPPGGTDLEGLGAAGDSGGPLLIEVDGKTLLVGVSSYAEYIDAEEGEESYGAMDFYARVSSYVSWIDGVMDAVEEGSAVPSEGPTPPGGIEDVAAGFPRNALGERAAAYFEAFNSGEAELFAEFNRRHRTDESLSRSSMADRLEGYMEAVGVWGRLQPLRWALTGPEELFVLVQADIGEMVFGLQVESESPHRLMTISVSY